MGIDEQAWLDLGRPDESSTGNPDGRIVPVVGWEVALGDWRGRLAAPLLDDGGPPHEPEAPEIRARAMNAIRARKESPA
jgi:hypothetical protein